MSSASNSGTGVNFSSNFFMRRFYSENRAAFASSTRSDYSKTQLAKEDSRALRRAIKNLSTYSFDEDDSVNVRSNVKAFVETYNNLVSSGKDSSDSDISRVTGKLTSLTKEYTDELDDIGITVNDDNTLSIRENLFANADISKFKSLFSSDSAFMQKGTSYTKRITSYSEDAIALEQSKAAAKKKPQAAASSTAAQSLSLENLCNTGIGKQINFIV